MSDAFFDTDLLIRYITGDDPAKRAAVRNLLRQAAQGGIRLYAPDTVMADAVYVLAPQGSTTFRVSRFATG